MAHQELKLLLWVRRIVGCAIDYAIFLVVMLAIEELFSGTMSCTVKIIEVSMGVTNGTFTVLAPEVFS